MAASKPSVDRTPTLANTLVLDCDTSVPTLPGLIGAGDRLDGEEGGWHLLGLRRGRTSGMSSCPDFKKSSKQVDVTSGWEES